MLKRLAVLISATLITATASAQGWVAPAVIGGIVGYGVGRSQPVQPQVIYQQPTPFLTYQQSGYDYVIDGNILQQKQALCYQSYPYDPMRQAYCLRDAEQHSRVFYRR